jgi:hypothetical protein
LKVGGMHNKPHSLGTSLFLPEMRVKGEGESSSLRSARAFQFPRTSLSG